MLIRSQNKMALVNIEGNKIDIEYAGDGKHGVYASFKYCATLGTYSSEEKAIKVLDMIQEAYADFEASKITNTGLATAAYTGSYKTPDSVSVGIKVLKGYAEMVKESVVFQMPEDSEVVV